MTSATGSARAELQRAHERPRGRRRRPAAPTRARTRPRPPGSAAAVARQPAARAARAAQPRQRRAGTPAHSSASAPRERRAAGRAGGRRDDAPAASARPRESCRQTPAAGARRHGSARERARIACRVPCTTLVPTMPPCPSTPAGRSRRSCSLALAGYASSTSPRWRTVAGARAARGRPGAGGWRPGAAAIARALRRAHLARRPARRAARVGAHGPAPAGRRHRADPAHPRRSRAASCARRRAASIASSARPGRSRSPCVRRRRLRRRHVALARAGALRRGARARAVHVLEHLSFARRRVSCTGGTCSPPSARACASAGWGPSPTWRSTKLLVGLLGIVLAFSPELLYDAYDSRRHPLGPRRRSTTSTSRG